VKAVEENRDLFYTLREGETCSHICNIEAKKEIINFTTKKYKIVLPKEEEKNTITNIRRQAKR